MVKITSIWEHLTAPAEVQIWVSGQNRLDLPLSKKYDNVNVYIITLISLVSRDRWYTCVSANTGFLL